MKKVLLSLALFISIGLTAWAQAPTAFNYQGIARSATGTPLGSALISLRLTIHDGSSTGTVDYAETWSTTTNQYGLYSVALGAGSPISTSPAFGTIPWGTSLKFLEVEIDPTGSGSDYSEAGTAQLLSVPYALYAANAPVNGVTSVTAGTGLNGGTITSTGTISLPSTYPAGTYGSATQVPMITTDAEGRVTSVTNTTITTGAGTVTTLNTTPGQLTGGPITTSGTIGLAAVGTPSTYGDGTHVPVFTTDAYGRVTSVISTPITVAGSGTVTSVTSGAGLVPGTITTTGTVAMPTVGTPGTYGSATGIPEITTDAFGRVTAVSVNPVSSITSTGTANYITKFTAPTAIANSAMYNTPGNQVGLGTITPAATFDAESATDTMAGNFVISNPIPSQNGVLNASYTGTGGTPTTNPVAIIGTSIPIGLGSSVGTAIVGIGGQLGMSGLAETEDPTGTPAGVQGQSYSDGVYSVGVLGSANAALVGASYNYGIYAVTDGSGGTADDAGYFIGDMDCTGTITGLVKAFKMDDPLDPANKYLYHSCVESNEMMDIYTGNVTTDASGVATVSLPAYMEALNRDFRYQLTVIGTFAQAIISKEISGNQFEIKTSAPNVKVSWEVTGVRHDPYALAHPMVSEVAKAAKDKGKYVSPASYGKSQDFQIGRVPIQQTAATKKIVDNLQNQKSNSQK